jgi:UDP-N-acetylmuramate dehydrogenase
MKHATTATLSELTTIGIGSEIERFYVANSSAELVEVVELADKESLPLLVLGHGSNILPADSPFLGVVVVYKCSWDGHFPKIPAGVALDDVVLQAIGQNETSCVSPEIVNLSGIPGTIGSAVVQNAGAYGSEIADFVQSVEVYDRKTSSISTLNADELGFSYRNSHLKQSIGYANGFSPQQIVLSVTLNSFGESEQFRTDTFTNQQLLDKRTEILNIRNSKGMLAPSFPYPNSDVGHDPDRRSCGSFFTNPIVAADFELPPDCPTYSVNDCAEPLKKVSAGWLIQHAGFEPGYNFDGNSQSCGARLSSKHALAIVNAGCATSSEVQALMDAIVQAVENKFKIHLEPEPIIISH